MPAVPSMDLQSLMLVDGPALSAPSLLREMKGGVGRMILGVAAGQSRRERINRTREQLSQAGLTILGVVLNRQHEHIPTWVARRFGVGRDR